MKCCIAAVQYSAVQEEYGEREWASHREGAQREKANYFTGTQGEGFK